MDVVIKGICDVTIGGGSHVGSFVEENLHFGSNDHPDSNIKLPPVVQERFLDILLSYPETVDLLGQKEALNVLETVEDFDSPALVHICLFYQP